MAFTSSFAEYPVGDLSIITVDDFSIDIHTLLHVFVSAAVLVLLHISHEDRHRAYNRGRVCAAISHAIVDRSFRMTLTTRFSAGYVTPCPRYPSSDKGPVFSEEVSGEF